jgi:hypothetical protein
MLENWSNYQEMRGGIGMNQTWPYRTDIMLKLKNKKQLGITKQPKPVADPPPLVLLAPAPASSPPSPKSQKRQQNSQPGPPPQGQQKTRQFLYDSDDDMPELPEELPEEQAPIAPPRVLAAWHRDGSALADIIDPDEECPTSRVPDNQGAVSLRKHMRWQRKSETAEEFGGLSVPSLFQWLMDGEYDCHIGISLEVHDME